MQALRISWRVLSTLALAVLALAGALWLWGGSSGSLPTALSQLAAYLPAGQTLEVKEVKGSLHQGGRIGWLRWTMGQLSVEATDVEVAWSLRPMLDGELRLEQLSVRHLRIDDQRAPSAPTPPADLHLPFKVDAHLQVDTLAWGDSPAQQITGLAGHYVFNSYSHILDKGAAHISSGIYQINARLQAQAPMALALQVQGVVETSLPSSKQTVRLQAQAELQGSLAGLDAALDLTAHLASQHHPMQAKIKARIQPWQAQPIDHARAHWQALNLAELWPQAPQTLLDGDATVTPAGPGWRASVTLANRQSGPWNQQRLPLEKLTANVVFAHAQWAIESLQAGGAGGRIESQGKLSSSAEQWQGLLSVRGINPAALDSRLAATVLNGQLSAQHSPSGIHVDGQLHTDDARLGGKVTFNTATSAVEGQLTLRVPGANAALDGHLASTQGLGDMRLRVTDAALAGRWLGRWPGVAAVLGNSTLQGGAEVSGHWQGGWQKQGQALQLQARVQIPKLDVRGADQPPEQVWHLREWQAELSGTLNALSLSVRGQADNATRHFTLQTQAQGGRQSAGVWQAQLNSAQLTAQDRLNPGAWTLQLSERLALGWRQRGTTQSLEVSAGSARLSGPVPGTAVVRWQAAQGSQQTIANTVQTRWHTQGDLQNVPLAWLALWGQSQMANLGLQGDLLFGGQWDASGGDALRLRATLERTAGDLQLQSTDASTQVGTLSAGVREAQLQISSEGDQVAAHLRWDSERAGQAQASFKTRLQRQDGTWRWPTDAPVTGQVHAQLPPVGAWSVLAPPGWRLQGTLDADATLSGTRSAPHWRGTLQARNLAVRSVVDGIDFSQGTLRASMQGDRLDLLDLTLQGAGDNGGVLSVKGAVHWLPAAGPAPSLISRLRMELEATAQALRVSTRADRRLVVSGQLSAKLHETRLEIRGKLKADQALFTLPEDTAPQLGQDVNVRRSSNASRTHTAAAPAPKTTAVRIKPDVVVMLDFGPDFQVRGQGLLTRLSGNLELRSTPDTQHLASLTGNLRTVRGSYKAYGQQLDIEQGLLHFTGPLENPALNILAVRPNLQQRVGVQISGTALSPVVRLYAEPELPEAEKLAWLVLGHSAANGGAEAAVLQQAALALLGGSGKGLSGKLSEALGLDELSMRGATSNADGSTATGATVTLGKRLSRELYVAYERSLAGTLGTFYLFYDLSRRFTLRAQTGEQSAVDLIYTLRYD